MPFTDILDGHKLNVNGREVTIEYVPAHPSNYSAGSWLKDHYVDHWIVGTVQSAVNVFQQPSRNASTTFVIGPGDTIYQMVPLSAAAWGNGSYASNLSGISTEHEGGWMQSNGVRKKPEQATHENSAHLKAYLESAIFESNEKFIRGSNHFKHSEKSATECCGSLDIDWIANEANRLIDLGVYSPGGQAASTNWLSRVTPMDKTMTLARDSQLINIDTKVGEGSYPAGTSLEIGGGYFIDGQEYMITKYSLSKEIKKGFRVEDFANSVTNWKDLVVPSSDNTYEFVRNGGLVEIKTGNVVKTFEQGEIIENVYGVYNNTHIISQWSWDNSKFTGIPVGQVQAYNANNEGLIEGYQEEIDELKAEIARLSQEAVVDTNTIGSLNTQIAAIQAQLNQAQQDLANQTTSSAQNLSALEQQIAELQNTINSQNSTIEEQEAAISTLEEQTNIPQAHDPEFDNHIREMAAVVSEQMENWKASAQAEVDAEIATANANNTPVPTWSWAQFRLGIAKNNIYNAILSFLGMFAGGEAIQSIAQIPQADEWGTLGGVVTSVLLIAGQQIKRIMEAGR